MPFFRFKCNKCEHVYTELLKYGESSTCPACSSKDVVKQITAPGGYKIKGDNSASVKPKHSGSFRGKN